MKKIVTVASYLAIMNLIMVSTSHAYLDPGTGSMLLQALAAVFIGLGLFWRRILDGIRSLFSNKDKKES